MGKHCPASSGSFFPDDAVRDCTGFVSSGFYWRKEFLRVGGCTFPALVPVPRDRMKSDLFDFPSYRILQVEETGGDFRIRAETVVPPVRCIHCESELLVGFGRREQSIRDLPVHAKRVVISVVTRRFRCNSCRKTFYEHLPEVDDKRLMTKRLLEWLEQRSLRQTFLQLGEETGMSNMTVRKVFESYERRLGRSIRFETPEVLGIDKACLIRRPRTVFTNVRAGLVLVVLAHRQEETVVRYLENLPDRHLIRWVVIDIWRPYLEAVRKSLPGATVIADKSSVVKMADGVLEQIRKTVLKTLPSDQRRVFMRSGAILLKRFRELTDSQKKHLSRWNAAYPLLHKAYWARERFYDLYAAHTRAEALAHFKSWEESLDQALRELFGPVTSLFHSWQDPILNHFDHVVTKACPDVAGNLVQAEIRMGRGYSFDVLRTRILLVPHGAHRKRSLSGRAGTGDIAAEPFPQYGERLTEKSALEISMGVDTSKLLDLIDKEEV